MLTTYRIDQISLLLVTPFVEEYWIFESVNSDVFSAEIYSWQGLWVFMLATQVKQSIHIHKSQKMTVCSQTSNFKI